MVTAGPDAEERLVIEEHLNYLKDLTRRAVLILAGRTLNPDEGVFGLVIFRAQSEDAAREIMNGDPAIRKGIMTGCLFPTASR
jgi:uncharacterized protein